MTKEQTHKILKRVHAAYPHIFNKQTAEQYSETLELWAACFVDYDMDIVAQAVMNSLFRKKDFPPTVGDVNAEITEMTMSKTARMTGEEAWSAAAALAEDGAGSQCQRPQVERRYKDLVSGNPALEKTLAGIGGIRAIGLCELSHENTLRAQFIRIYNAHAKSCFGDMGLPPSARSRTISLAEKYEVQTCKISETI